MRTAAAARNSGFSHWREGFRKRFKWPMLDAGCRGHGGNPCAKVVLATKAV